MDASDGVRGRVWQVFFEGGIFFLLSGVTVGLETEIRTERAWVGLWSKRIGLHGKALVCREIPTDALGEREEAKSTIPKFKSFARLMN